MDTNKVRNLHYEKDGSSLRFSSVATIYINYLIVQY